MPVTPSEFGLQGFAFPSVPAVICDYPNPGDVRLGTTYGDGAYTGTLTAGTTPTSPDALHSPADIARWVLIGLAVVSDPDTALAWPCFTGAEPPSPDEAVTTYDTAGGPYGRSMPDGDILGTVGFQVRVRATTHGRGWAKAEQLQEALASVYQRVVTIGTTSYLVRAIVQIGDVLSLGRESPTSRRLLFTINAQLVYERL
jgi:hypothetical protein